MLANGLMDWEYALAAEDNGDLTALPSRNSWDALTELLDEIQRVAPRPDILANKGYILASNIYNDEDVEVGNHSEDRRRGKRVKKGINRYGFHSENEPFGYDMLVKTGFLKGTLKVLMALKKVNPISLGIEQTTFGETVRRLEDTFHRWINMHPQGGEGVLKGPKGNPICELARGIMSESGVYYYDSDPEKMNEDELNMDDDGHVWDTIETGRVEEKYQTELFARHEHAELVDFLNKTKEGKEMYGRFKEHLAQRLENGSYPYPHVNERVLEKFLIPKKKWGGERDV
jgi:hypothetical protein